MVKRTMESGSVGGHLAQGVCFKAITEAQRMILASGASKTLAREAFHEFARTAQSSNVPPILLRSLLIQQLHLLSKQVGVRLDVVIARFLDEGQKSGLVDAFEVCVEEAFRCDRITNPNVQQAISIIRDSYKQPGLRLLTIAKLLRMRPSHLCTTFKKETALTVRQYVEATRLKHAADLLVTSTKSIKEIWVDSGYNHASDFTHSFKRQFGTTPRRYRAIRWPLSQQAVYSAREEVKGDDLKRDDLKRDDPAVPAKKVLVVEDDDATRSMLAEVLTGEGYVAILSRTAGEALREAQGITLSHVILEYSLPDMDGITCLGEIRELRRARDVPVTVFTADWTLAERAADVQALNATIAFKPIEIAELLRLLATPS